MRFSRGTMLPKPARVRPYAVSLLALLGRQPGAALIQDTFEFAFDPLEFVLVNSDELPVNEKPKAVFSHTLKNAEWGPAEIFGGELSAEIADLKARDDEGTVLVHGGPDFAQSLTRLGLVDEYQLSTVPIAIGAGCSPFAKLDEHLKLDVVEEQRFRSGALAQTLVPRR